jgi:hypothetical protein
MGREHMTIMLQIITEYAKLLLLQSFTLKAGKLLVCVATCTHIHKNE